MTPAEILIAQSLGRCSFLPASWDKRFCRDIAATATNKPNRELSEFQNANLLRLAHKYRRQLPVEIIELALDEMERNADRRVAEGHPSQPLFRRPRAPSKSRKAKTDEPGPTPAPLPLFGSASS